MGYKDSWASWWHKIALIFISPSATKMWHPCINRSTSIGFVGHSTIHQGTWEGSCSPVCQVISRQYLVPALEHTRDCELWLLSAVLLENMQNIDLPKRESLWKSRFSGRKRPQKNVVLKDRAIPERFCAFEAFKSEHTLKSNSYFIVS